MNIQPFLPAAFIAVGSVSLYKGFSKWNGVGVRRVTWLSFQSIKATLPNFSNTKKLIELDNSSDCSTSRVQGKYLPLTALERSALKIGSLYLLIGALGVGLGAYSLQRWKIFEETHEQMKQCQRKTGELLCYWLANRINTLKDFDDLRTYHDCPIRNCHLSDNTFHCEMPFKKTSLEENEIDLLVDLADPRKTVSPFNRLGISKVELLLKPNTSSNLECEIPTKKDVLEVCSPIFEISDHLRTALIKINTFTLSKMMVNAAKDLADYLEREIENLQKTKGVF